MGKHSGDLVEVGIGVEDPAARGTAVASQYGGKWTSFSLVNKAMMAIDESRSGIIEDSRGSNVVGTYAEGDVEGPIRDRAIGAILFNLFGANTPAAVGGETLVYDHAFTIGQNNIHPSLTIIKKDPNETVAHANAMVSALEISVTPEQLATFKAGIRAKAKAASGSSISYALENIFTSKHCSLKITDVIANLAGATAINVRSLKLSINQNIEDERTIGNVAQVDIVNKKIDVKLDVEITMTAATYITALLAGTNYAALIDLNNTDVTIGNSSHPRLQIQLNKITLQDAPPAYKAGDIVTQTLSFKAHYNETDSAMISATLRNLVAAYVHP